MTEPSRTPDERTPLAEELPDDGTAALSKRPPTRGSRLSSFAAAQDVRSAEVETRMRQANLLRVRGDLPGAVRELRAALGSSPSDAAIHEMIGDILVKLGDSARAYESYAAAQANGGGASIEAKIARIVVQRDTGRRSIGDETLIRGNGAVPIVASAVIPGAGLILSGETRAGLISIIGWLISLGLMLSVPSIRAALPPPIGDGTGHVSPVATLAAVLLGVANLAFYVYSLVETVRVAKPTGKDGQDD